MPTLWKRIALVLTGLAVLGLSVASPAQAAVFTFDSDPFDGSTALTTPGRQVVGGEPSINFATATDVFRFDPAFFAIGTQIHFVNALAADLPNSGVNVIVLQDTDDDATLGTPFGAGNAANLIAAEITAPGAGLFVYFNSSLGVPRLVYSTDLSVGTADLKILARMTNLTGNDLLAFSDANFDIVTTVTAVPEPSTLLLLIAGGLIVAGARRRRI